MATNIGPLKEAPKNAMQAPELLWRRITPEPDARMPWGWLAALMALAAVLRAIALSQQLWYDEITTLVEFVRTPLGHIVTTYTSQNQHMLYSVLARFSVVTFGDTIWALRLPAVIFGVLCIPALYACARLWVTKREALLGCALLAVSYHHVWFSQNARGYTGLAFFTLLSTWCFVRGAQSAGMKWWIGYGISVALGMYVHLSMGFIAAGHGVAWLWMLFSRHKEIGRMPPNGFTPTLGFVFSGVLSAILYAPVMGQMLKRTVGGEGARGATEVVKAEWRSPLWLVMETLRGLAGSAGWVGMVAVLAAGVIVLAGCWAIWKENRFAIGLIFFPIVVTAGVTFVLSRNLWPRFFFFAIGFAMVLLVRGVMWLAGMVLRGDSARAMRYGTGLTVLILLASCWQLRAAYLYPKQDYAGAMAFVEANRRSTDAIRLAGLTTMPYQQYYKRDWPAVETPGQLEDAQRAAGGRVWVLYTLPIYIESRYPELWNTLRSQCTTQKIFRGTMGGGEVYVCRVDN
jgi:uncharacterized membrane protein